MLGNICLCAKEISSDTFENDVYKMCLQIPKSTPQIVFTNHIYLIRIYKKDLA